MARTKVQAELIATNAISGTIIADNAITATHIATNSISGTLIQDSGIVTTMIAANNITSTKIVTDGVLTRHIADDQVTEAKLANAINTSIAAKLPLAGGNITGNLGIGQTSPSAPLDLVTSSNVYAAEFTQSNTSNGDGVFISVGSTAAADYALTVRSDAGNTSVLAAKANGNVGIGTFSPGATLHVDASGGANFQVSRTGVADMVYIEADGTNGVIRQPGDGALVFQMGGTSEKMRIASDGKVGIGTTSPDGQLHVKGATNNTIKLDFTMADGTGTYTLNSYARNGTNKWRLGSKADDSYLSWYNDQTSSHQFALKSDGNVGIGTTSPVFKLHLKDAANTAVYQKFTNDTTGNTSNDGSTIGIDADGDLIVANAEAKDIKFFTSDTERMRITSTGNVGIGTDSPGVPFVIQVPASAVNAEMRFQSGAYTSDHFKAYANQSGRFYIQAVSNTSHGVYLQYNGTSWASASDERLKENIVELENVLPKITNLRAVKYNFIADEENTTAIGFIAQDWQTDFSEVVSDSIPEELGMNYTETIPVLLKAIQEQQTIIEDLKSRVETLEG